MSFRRLQPKPDIYRDAQTDNDADADGNESSFDDLKNSVAKYSRKAFDPFDGNGFKVGRYMDCFVCGNRVSVIRLSER